MEAMKLNAASPFIYFFFLFMLVSLIYKKFFFNIIQSRFFKKISFHYSFGLILLLLGQWIFKIFVFFSQNSIPEYLSMLLKNKNFWLLWA